jgi:hypothetical protein
VRRLGFELSAAARRPVLTRPEHALLDVRSAYCTSDSSLYHALPDTTTDATLLMTTFLCSRHQHGRSSGLHCFIKDENALPLALDAVMRDLIRLDLAAGRPKRKAALVGHSLGGWTMCVVFVWASVVRVTCSQRLTCEGSLPSLQPRVRHVSRPSLSDSIATEELTQNWLPA